MRSLLIIAASIVTSTTLAVSAMHGAAAQATGETNPLVVLDNPRVRVYRATATGPLTGVDHGPGVLVSVEDSPGVKAGFAVWMEDAALPSRALLVRDVIVQPRGQATAATPPAAGSKPGAAPFTGMSFKPIFENDRVSVIRARMEVGAREGFHTHGSDTIVVHLSGGEIEDTAAGKTVVNRWKRGDVEFEGLGTSHSARNIGGAVDVVLVALKRQ
jgi:hypothetical protein